MRSTPYIAILFLAIGCTSQPQTPQDPNLLLHETFQKPLNSNWHWIREDKSAWRITDRGLEVHIQPGNMWGPANDAKNLLVYTLPKYITSLEITASVQNHPTSQYEQTDLAWYFDDGHMVKIAQEMVDGKLSIVMGREENDKTRTIAIIPLDSDSVQLRFQIHGLHIVGQFKTPTSDWHIAGECDAPSAATPNVCLQFYQGPANETHWARVSELAIRRL